MGRRAVSNGPWRVAFVGEMGQAFTREIFLGVASFTRQHAVPWSLHLAEVHNHRLLRAEIASADAVLGTVLTRLLPRLTEPAGLPLVNLSSFGVRLARVSVTTDNEAIGRMAATYLLERGLRTFAVLRLPGRDVLDARKAAFRRTVEAAGRVCHDLDLKLAGERRDADALAAQTRDLPRPFGLYCRTDAVAFRVLPVLERAGLRIPEDIAVVGTDNDEMLCETSRPPLTSIELAVDRLGHRAAAILLDWLRGRPPPDGVERIPPLTVVERKSTGLWAVEDDLVARALDRIETEPLGSFHVGALARDLGVVRRTLDRRFQAVLGRTPAQEIRRRQVARACQLLLETDWPVTRVALACGMENPEHLSRFMRAHTGESPTGYRDKRRLA